MMATFTKALLVLGVVFSSSVVLCTQAMAQSSAKLYQTKDKMQRSLKEEDEDVLNALTAIRYHLMIDEKLKAISKIKSLSGKLADATGHNRYNKAGLLFLRLKEGRDPVFLYHLASYDGEISKKGARIYPEMELFKGAKRESIKASLDMSYTPISSALAKAFGAAMKGKLDKADGYLQALYEDMISDAVLANDPVEISKAKLKESSSLLKQGKVADAIALIDESEALLGGYVKVNPKTSYARNLSAVAQGYDKIRSYNFGKAGEAPSVRNKIFYAVSDMRSKLKPVKIEFEL